METKPKKWYRTPKGLVIIFIIALSTTILQMYISDNAKKNQIPNKIIMENSETPIIIDGFEWYNDEVNKFQVLFPEKPEVTTQTINDTTIKHYKTTYFDNNNDFVQYSIAYTDTDLYKTDSINKYLDSYIKSKAIGSDLIKNEITEYKKFPARKYLIQYTSEGLLVTNRGIAFIANGDSVDLSLNYLSTLNEDKTNFNEYTNSFTLK